MNLLAELIDYSYIYEYLTVNCLPTEQVLIIAIYKAIIIIVHCVVTIVIYNLQLI